MADNRNHGSELHTSTHRGSTGFQIAVPLINANNFELNKLLINLVQRCFKDTAAGGNFLDKMPLKIELKEAPSKCKVQQMFPRSSKIPGKFLIPCALQELDRTNALADFGASINLLPHSIYKQLRLEALTPTRMTLELANRSITHPMGIAEDVVVRVDGFTFLADFVVVEFCTQFPRYYLIIREGDVTFLDNLLSDDTTHNLASKMISDHEPKQNKSLISFSPRSDPLHHEFVGELLTLPSRNDHAFGEYLSLMTVLCEISTSRSQKNVHANQSSLSRPFPLSSNPPPLMYR
ncbi:reverse transcriptase domain-containing protein [Tanacetum coccineum]